MEWGTKGRQTGQTSLSFSHTRWLNLELKEWQLDVSGEMNPNKTRAAWGRRVFLWNHSVFACLRYVNAWAIEGGGIWSTWLHALTTRGQWQGVRTTVSSFMRVSSVRLCSVLLQENNTVSDQWSGAGLQLAPAPLQWHSTFGWVTPQHEGESIQLLSFLPLFCIKLPKTYVSSCVPETKEPLWCSVTSVGDSPLII